jgi:hypothetical protein
MTLMFLVNLLLVIYGITPSAAPVANYADDDCYEAETCYDTHITPALPCNTGDRLSSASNASVVLRRHSHHLWNLTPGL